ncbi:MAG: Panacea domain-containing protein [bacterium]|nr:Panacea domain-containing protein [bacterium]
MQYQKDKFINAVLFFAKNTDPNKFGITKLVKLLFFADFLHFERYGRPIIGDEYYHLPEGPVPTTSYDLYKSTFEKQIKTGLEKYINVSPTKVGLYTINKIEAKEECNEDVFSDSDVEVMKEIAKKFYNETGTGLAKMTHEIPFVKDTPPIFPIDYINALKDEGDREYIKDLQKEDQLIENALSE